MYASRSESLGWNSSSSWWTTPVSDCDTSIWGAVQSDSARQTSGHLVQSGQRQQTCQHRTVCPSLRRSQRLQCVSITQFTQIL